MTCHHNTRPHSSGPTPTQADILTYRYNQKMVYVPAAPDYNQALSHARNAFPQLKGLRDTSLSLSLSKPPESVGISAPAWPTLLAHMVRYQVVEVQVSQAHERNGDPAVRIPEITITYADADDSEEAEPAPPYPQAVAGRGSSGIDDEKAPYPRPRSPSTPTLHPKRSWFFQKLHGQ